MTPTYANPSLLPLPAYSFYVGPAVINIRIVSLIDETLGSTALAPREAANARRRALGSSKDVVALPEALHDP